MSIPITHTSSSNNSSLIDAMRWCAEQLEYKWKNPPQDLLSVHLHGQGDGLCVGTFMRQENAEEISTLCQEITSLWLETGGMQEDLWVVTTILPCRQDWTRAKS